MSILFASALVSLIVFFPLFKLGGSLGFYTLIPSTIIFIFGFGLIIFSFYSSRTQESELDERFSFKEFLAWFFFILATALIFIGTYISFWISQPHVGSGGEGAIMIFSAVLAFLGWGILLTLIFSSAKGSQARKLTANFSKVFLVLFLLSLVIVIYRIFHNIR